MYHCKWGAGIIGPEHFYPNIFGHFVLFKVLQIINLDYENLIYFQK